MKRWSLAARLTAWYAVIAFVLLASAMFVQYRTLARSLADEDDQLIAQWLDTRQTDAAPAARIDLSGERGPYLRTLDSQCRVLGSEVPAEGPPPVCDPSAGPGPAFRSWHVANDEEWRIASRKSSNGWIEAALNRALDVGVVEDYRRRLALVLAVTMLALATLGYVLVRRELAPLSTLAERMGRVTAHSLDQRLSAADVPAEIGPVVESFDSMLRRLEGAFRALTEFSADLAHELRTPLHIIRQQTEVSLQRARTPEEYRETLGSILEELDVLQRMVDDTLFLAQAEDPRARTERARLLVADEIADVASYVEALASEHGVSIICDAHDGLSVEGNQMLVRRALVNLVSNAIRHTPAKGTITLRGRRVDDAVELEVSDTGSGIDAAALPHVFDRHFRSPLPEDGTLRGAGLGLAIVRGIMQLHDGTAVATSAMGQGTTVTLRFPD